LTSDTVWDLRELPDRLVVLGGGPIGCELGQAFARLGSAVTIVEMDDRLLPPEEPEAGAVLRAVLGEEGVTVRTGTRAVRVDDTPDGPVLVVETTDDRAQTTRVPFDRILVAAGRRPTTQEMGLESNGVALEESGHVVVDDSMRTTADWVFAAGDVTGELPFTHAAGAQGGLVVTNALFGLRRRFDASVVPWATYTEPEVGRIGMTEAEAIDEHGEGDVTVARFDNDRLDRAIAASATEGFTKLVAGPKGRIVGATVVSDRGGDVVAAVTAWVSQGASLSDVGQTTIAYPSFAEAPTKAAGEVLRERFLSPRVRRLTSPLLGAARLVDRPWRQR
jgi:pyruvate/2-oxoglutarate dehydrogenase complex dihydrolipoamide dehydrogenase (E3) component